MSSEFEFLGPYRIEEPLGRGGMGTVYSGVHAKSGERVAVKLIAAHVANEPRFRRRFDAEVKTLQRLRHDGIVRLIGFGEERGQLFYSMELVEGESLQKRIRREKRLDWQTTIDIAIQICAALKHAHDIGVIHRDLKPANLIITENDQVKLVDFGIAKIFGDGEQTMAGSVLGTADYMAPEQASSTGITARTDLYALGSVMYAMLTSRPPFTGKKVTEVIESLKRERPVPLGLINPELPDAVVSLVHELLEKDPADRPPTALAVMNRLKAMRAGLQREQTILADELPTEAGAAEERETNLTDGGLGSAATGLADDKKDSKHRTIVSKGGPGVSRDGPESKGVSQHSADEQTFATGAGPTAMPGESEPLVEEKKTHFQTVDESSSASGIFKASNETEGGRLNLILLVAVLLCMFGGGVWFLQSTRLRGASELYDVIVAKETGGPQRMQAMEEYLRRFTEEEQFDEVHGLYLDAKLVRTIRRLNARFGKPLDAMEQGFLDAMTAREERPTEAIAQLDAWLNVHDSSTKRLEPQEQEMVELATHAIKTLRGRQPEVPIDSRAKELLEKIRDSVEKAPVDETRKLLEGIVTIHGEDAWAQPAVEEAQRQLDALAEEL